MTTRRDLMTGVLGMAVAGSAAAQAEENHATTFHRQNLPAPFDGWVAEFAKVTMEPGPGYAPHRHKGFVLGYVIDGQFRFALDSQPERVLNAGEAFYEPPGALHTISASASSTRAASILAMVISKRGETAA